MQKVKIVYPENGIIICLGYWEAMKRIKGLDPSVFVDSAYRGNGYIGFNLETGETVGAPGPTIIKLYEITKNNKKSIHELRNQFRQNWYRLQREIEKGVTFFYTKYSQTG